MAFCSLAQCLQSEYRALEAVANYPGVLALPADRTQDSFVAWSLRMQDEKAARGLVTRRPQVLTRRPSEVAETDDTSVMLTVILSYLGEIGRELGRRLRRRRRST